MSFALERFTISSGRMAPRDVTVYVPGAHREAAPLPLLILLDGQNLFDPDRAFVPGQHWRVAEAAEALIAAGRIAPLIIAGVDHAGQGRNAEFTPARSDQPGGPGVAEYGRFLLDDLVPYLRRAYGVQVDADHLALGGSSLGGLATLAIAQQWPGRIGRLLVMSPSVWWDDRMILRRLRRVGFQSRPRVWLDIGRREGAGALTDARALRDVLIWQTSALRYTEVPEGAHSEHAWAARFPEALEWLYSGSSGSSGSSGP